MDHRSTQTNYVAILLHHLRHVLPSPQGPLSLTTPSAPIRTIPLHRQLLSSASGEAKMRRMKIPPREKY